MNLPLVTSGGTVGIAPLALIDLHTNEGVTGRTYLFCYTPLVLKPVCDLLPISSGPRGRRRRAARARPQAAGPFRLLGAKGIAGMALAGIDMAAWDALSKAAGSCRWRGCWAATAAESPPTTAAVWALIGAERAAAEAQELVRAGFPAIKVRLGYPDLQPTSRSCAR